MCTISFFSTLLKTKTTYTYFFACSKTAALALSCRTYAKMTHKKQAMTRRVPLSFHHSGDIVLFEPLDNNTILRQFQELEALNKAPDTVRKLFSVQFASKTEQKLHREDMLRKRIVDLFGPSANEEIRVARLTIQIRNLIPHCLTIKKDKRNKSLLLEKIDKRKKLLKMLRRTDYQRFMWLLQELRIRYVLPPESNRRETKREKRERDVRETAEKIRADKISVLRQQLEQEKAQFMEEKVELLNDIDMSLEHFKLDRDDFVQQLKREPENPSPRQRPYWWFERLDFPDDHPWALKFDDDHPLKPVWENGLLYLRYKEIMK